MAAPFKLTFKEGKGLVEALIAEVGIAKVVAACVATLGAARAKKLIENPRGVRFSESDTLSLFQNLFVYAKGNTTKEKIAYMAKIARDVFADDVRFKAAFRAALDAYKQYTSGVVIPPESFPVLGTGTVAGYGPVNHHWHMDKSVLTKVLNRMALKNVRYYTIECVGHGNEDVLGTPAKMAQAKERIAWEAQACHDRRIIFAPIFFNDNAGLNKWNNAGASLEERYAQCVEFIDWFAATIPPTGVVVTIVSETRTDSGRKLEIYGAKVLKAAGFQIANNQGADPQSTTSFGGIQTEYFVYHPSKTTDWPKSTSAHIVGDHGALLAQLNVGRNVYGLGNPDAIRAWGEDGKRRGYAVMAYYAFDCREYDEAAIDAISYASSSPGVVDAPTESVTTADDVDLSKAKWIGPNGAGASVTESLTNLRMSADKISYSMSEGCAAWGPAQGEKNTTMYSCFMVKRDGRLVGGKFDHSTYSRKDRETTNIRSGYTGGIIPIAGEETRIFMLENSLKRRTNAPGIAWVS